MMLWYMVTVYTIAVFILSLMNYTELPYEVGPRYKFFPPLATFDPPYPIAPDGFLPNSIVLSKLRKSQADQELAKAWKPPTISDKQRLLMEQVSHILK